MTELLISDHPLSKEWISQFNTHEDRALASRLLNQLKFISEREFESGIEKSLIKLQERLGKTIAVYPVIPAPSKEISGHNLFTGGIPASEDSNGHEIGRRRKYGSEDRVGHFVSKLQEQYKRGNGVSKIECTPTIKQLKTQKIQNIVLIDDICGSGQRIIDFWKNCVPRSIKSLLSYKRLELWIIFFAITPIGKKTLKYSIPNFPINTHLITLLPETDYRLFLDRDLISLSSNYSKMIGMESAGLGYKKSGGLVIFEHGCPNNVPAILWAKKRNWKGLFPNRGIPTELRPYFDEEGVMRSIESLWNKNQENLALALLENIDKKKVSPDESLMLIQLGLLLKGVTPSKIGAYLLVSIEKSEQLINLAVKYFLYSKQTGKVTSFGKEFLKRYRNNYGYSKKNITVENKPNEYYPSQCEGEFRFSGKSPE